MIKAIIKKAIIGVANSVTFLIALAALVCAYLLGDYLMPLIGQYVAEFLLGLLCVGCGVGLLLGLITLLMKAYDWLNEE